MSENDADKDQQMFMGLVSMLHENAMMAMGKIVPPGSEEPIVQLPLASAMIDMLDVVKKRTQGNLAEREEKWLEVQLTNLRLNYLEVQKDLAKKGEAGEGSSSEGDAEAEAGGTS